VVLSSTVVWHVGPYQVRKKEQRSRLTGKTPGADEDEAYQENDKQYKKTALALSTSQLFLATMHISLVAKRPLFNFHLWAQQEFKKQRERRHLAERSLRVWALTNTHPKCLLPSLQMHGLLAKSQCVVVNLVVHEPLSQQGL